MAPVVYDELIASKLKLTLLCILLFGNVDKFYDFYNEILFMIK